MMSIKPSSSSSNRMPFQTRNPNTMGPAGSFNNSSTEEYNSKDMAAMTRISNLESSGNENNKRMTNSNSNSYGGNAAIRRSSSNAEVRDQAEPVPQARSSSAPRPTLSQRSSSMPNTMDEDSVIIEEKRRKVNGEGYTLHRYLRGKLLGKGGFAKVYLATALDTNKAYAIKIVPKANLVKARARQKVRCSHRVS
jgi:polo-like kinase 1